MAIVQLKALNRYQRTVRAVKHAQHTVTGTAEPLTTQPELLSTALLAELQHLHGLNTHGEFDGTDDDTEFLTITEPTGSDYATCMLADTQNNTDYDHQYLSDEAAKWLRSAGF